MLLLFFVFVLGVVALERPLIKHKTNHTGMVYSRSSNRNNNNNSRMHPNIITNVHFNIMWIYFNIELLPFASIFFFQLESHVMSTLRVTWQLHGYLYHNTMKYTFYICMFYAIHLLRHYQQTCGLCMGTGALLVSLFKYWLDYD